MLYAGEQRELDGVDDVLVLDAPEPVDALVAQLLERPPAGASVVAVRTFESPLPLARKMAPPPMTAMAIRPA